MQTCRCADMAGLDGNTHYLARDVLWGPIDIFLMKLENCSMFLEFILAWAINHPPINILPWIVIFIRYGTDYKAFNKQISGKTCEIFGIRFFIKCIFAFDPISTIFWKLYIAWNDLIRLWYNAYKCSLNLN